MSKSSNLYNYKTPKSGNEETGFFNIKGRITRTTFFIRLLLAIAIYFVSSFFYGIKIFSYFNLRVEIFLETIHLYILPFLLLAFILIQGAKRIHDVNKTGWFFFVPIYNIFLLVLPGSKGANGYGLDPIPLKRVQYFDELESKETKGYNELNISGLDKWRIHLSEVRNRNPKKSYQQCIVIAKKSFKSSSKKK